MPNWPDQDETLINQFVKQLNLNCYSAPYRSLLRKFQRFVAQRFPKRPFSEAVLRAWLKDELKTAPLPLVVHRGQLVNRFLDWLAARGAIAANPIAELRRKYECRSSAAVLRALAGAQPAKALESLRPPPRYGSHLGPIMREHVNRMRIRGLRYRHENRFLHFDRFLQQRPGADQEPLTTLIREYAACASSAAGKVQRIRARQSHCQGTESQWAGSGGAETRPGADAGDAQKPPPATYLHHRGSPPALGCGTP